MPESYGLGAQSRGPYGTNEGDIWLMGDYYQERVKREEGPGWRMIIEMQRRDGVVQEVFYTTDDPELVERADRGHERYVERIAQEN